MSCIDAQMFYVLSFHLYLRPLNVFHECIVQTYMYCIVLECLVLNVLYGTVFLSAFVVISCIVITIDCIQSMVIRTLGPWYLVLNILTKADHIDTDSRTDI